MKVIHRAHQYHDGWPLILAVDRGGRPSEWINWQKAACHHICGDVMWGVGEPALVLRGGYNRQGERSELALQPVIAIKGADASRFEAYIIPLSNRALFSRDRFTCLYCGERYHPRDLSRDHVIPRSRPGGVDAWENVVTACKPCNHQKDCRTPAEAGMELLALPFAPNHIEGLILSNRRILADQMDFLVAQRPRRKRGDTARHP